MALARAAAQQDQGSGDAILARLIGVFGPEQLLNTVFKAFCETNVFRDRHFDIRDILAGRLPFQGRRHYFRFMHFSIPYLATVYVWHGPHRPWLMIKLPNNGFDYAPIAGPDFWRHQCGGWVRLEMPLVLQFFPDLRGAVQGKFEKVSFLYNYTHDRLDIRLYPKTRDQLAVEINFEPGSPYT